VKNNNNCKSFLVNEKKQLGIKITRMVEIMNSAEFKELNDVEQMRITRQICAMEWYSEILEERINNFTG
jgi:hypothetical protein